MKLVLSKNFYFFFIIFKVDKQTFSVLDYIFCFRILRYVLHFQYTEWSECIIDLTLLFLSFNEHLRNWIYISLLKAVLIVY